MGHPPGTHHGTMAPATTLTQLPAEGTEGTLPRGCNPRDHCQEGCLPTTSEEPPIVDVIWQVRRGVAWSDALAAANLLPEGEEVEGEVQSIQAPSATAAAGSTSDLQKGNGAADHVVSGWSIHVTKLTRKLDKEKLERKRLEDKVRLQEDKYVQLARRLQALE